MSPEFFKSGVEVKGEKNKSSQWKANYEEARNQLFADNKIPTTEELTDVILKNGILDRVAPLDEAVKKERIKNHQYVFEGNRSDPRLFLRLIYANLAYRNGLKMSAAPSWVNAAGLAIHRMIMAIIERDGECDSENVISQILDSLDSRLKNEYRRLGGENTELISVGSRLDYHGIFCAVSGYNPDGTIRVEADTDEGHRQLYKFTKGGGIEPTTLKDEEVEILNY